MNSKFIIAVIFLLTACSREEFTGRIISKQHSFNRIEQPIVIEPGFTEHVISRHNYPASRGYDMWTLHIATAKTIHKIQVTEDCFKSLRITDKIKVRGNKIKLIQRQCK